MKYTISESKLRALPGVKHMWQCDGAYCAWGKAIVAATGLESIGTLVHYYDDIGAMCFEQEALAFINDMIAIDRESYQEAIELNDAEGSWESTHLAAVEKVIDVCRRSGIVEVVS